MASRTVVLFVCDLCGRTSKNDDKAGADIVTHELRIDRAGVKVDLCDQCWNPVAEKIETVLRVGEGSRGLRKTLLESAG